MTLLLGIHAEKTIIEKDTCTPVFTAALFTIARTRKQPRHPLRWVDKEAMVHMHNGILLNHKKEPLWVSANEKDEPGAYYTEVSQKEKNKYCVLTHKYRIWEGGTDEPMCRAAMEMQTRRTHLRAGCRRRGRTSWTVAWKCMSHHRQARQPSGTCSVTPGAQARALWQPQGLGRGGRWEGDSRAGTLVHGWLVRVGVWQKPARYCTAIVLQSNKFLKILCLPN